MPRPASVSLAEIEDLKAKGLNQSEIARQLGVSRAYISWIKHTYGGKLTPREVMMRDHFPWEVEPQFGSAGVLQHVRNHGEYMMTGGVGMSEGELKRLAGFHNRLRKFGLVVEYDPAIPPSPEVTMGGFAYRTREPADEHLIVRVNEYCHLTDEGREKIWVLPPEEEGEH